MADEEEEIPPPPHPLHQVSIKAPQFMEENVGAWFSIMEAQFNIAKIVVSSTRFYHVLSSLPPNIVAKIPQNVLNAVQYVQLKEAVISTYEKSKPEMLDNLMKSTSVTGKPSVFLNELISLAGRIGVGNDIIRHKFIQALPPTIAPVIASQTDIEMSKLGKLADDLVLYFNKQDGAYSVQETSSEIHQVGQNYYQHRSRPNFQSSFSGNSKLPWNVRPYNKDQKTKVCRAHLYFGDRANNCKKWCQWPNKAGLSIQPNSRASSPASGRRASFSGRRSPSPADHVNNMEN